MATLFDMVALSFSKNAGLYLRTIECVFSDHERYDHVRNAGVFTPARIAKRLGRISASRVLSIHERDPACIMKFTIVRDRPSGDLVTDRRSARSSAYR
jgi:hypothetical protein